MAIPNYSEKSVALDREENITRGNLSAKQVAVFSYDANTDKLVPGTQGFSPHANVSTEIVTNGTVKTITQTDGVKTCTITIDSTDPLDKSITKVWS